VCTAAQEAAGLRAAGGTKQPARKTSFGRSLSPARAGGRPSLSSPLVGASAPPLCWVGSAAGWGPPCSRGEGAARHGCAGRLCAPPRPPPPAARTGVGCVRRPARCGQPRRGQAAPARGARTPTADLNPVAPPCLSSAPHRCSEQPAKMAKSKNHTNHNQNYKAHRNGIKKPQAHRHKSRQGVRRSAAAAAPARAHRLHHGGGAAWSRPERRRGARRRSDREQGPMAESTARVAGAPRPRRPAIAPAPGGCRWAGQPRSCRGGGAAAAGSEDAAAGGAARCAAAAGPPPLAGWVVPPIAGRPRRRRERCGDVGSCPGGPPASALHGGSGARARRPTRASPPLPLPLPPPPLHPPTDGPQVPAQPAVRQEAQRRRRQEELEAFPSLFMGSRPLCGA